MPVEFYFKYHELLYDVGTKVRFKQKYQWQGITEGTVIRINPNSIDVKHEGDVTTIYRWDIESKIIEIVEPVYYTKVIESLPNNRVYPSESSVELGWIWYIIIMVVGAIFKDKLMIWVCATAYFFMWKNGLFGGRK